MINIIEMRRNHYSILHLMFYLSFHINYIKYYINFYYFNFINFINITLYKLYSNNHNRKTNWIKIELPQSTRYKNSRKIPQNFLSSKKAKYASYLFYNSSTLPLHPTPISRALLLISNIQSIQTQAKSISRGPFTTSPVKEGK